jgi:hypothetical protein
MRRPTKKGLNQATRAAVTHPLSLPPPIGGWNARDALTGMQPNDAIVLDNWIPDIGNVKTRPGYISWATGLGGFVETLMEYAPPTGANKLFAATPTAIYDVTSQGAVGAAAVTGLTGGRWQHTMFSALGGTYLFAANGTDGIRQYDGTTWTTPAITGTGFVATNIVAVVSYQSRLWLVENGSLRIWYLPVGSIAGTATAFDMGAIFKLGGSIVTMGSWSRDGGAGPDDLAVIISSKGEVLIYSITDPTTLSGVSLQGLFRVAEPVGRRCLMKVGADLGIITSHGFAALSTMLQINVAGDDQAAVTNKIAGAFQTAYASSGSNFGWQPIEYPKGNLVLVNVPLVERSLQQQYVLNVKTGAWCRFTGMSAGCWSLLGTDLMWGDNSGTVWKYDQGTTDNGAAIVATFQTAYSIGGPNQQDQGVKRCALARIYMTGPPGLTPAVQLQFDYDTTIISAPLTLPTYGNAAGLGAIWDLALWDSASWGATGVPGLRWQTVRGSGVAVSVGISVKILEQISINGVDVLYEKGGLL